MDLNLYRRLFVHRSDVFAEQDEHGNWSPVRRELTDDDIAEHLEGFVSYGVYVIRPDGFDVAELAENKPNTVSYVVFDLDTYDADALDFLTRAVERLVAPEAPAAQGSERLRCLLLEDSGGKGYHIWLLLSEPVPAALARSWAEVIRPQYMRMARVVPEGNEPWPVLEIFPKQDTVAEGGFGNLVKLPFGVHGKTHTQSVMKLHHGWATSLEEVVAFPASLIPVSSAPRERTQAPERSEGRRAPFACVSKLLESGAPDGCRDKAMYHFARFAFAQGLPDDLVLEWCERVNEKFDPPMEPAQVRIKVRSAGNADAPNPGCSADWLENFCPGGPHCYAPWNDRQRSEERSEYPADMTPDERRAWRLKHDAGNAD